MAVAAPKGVMTGLPISHVPFARDEIRCLRASYTALACALAMAALTADGAPRMRGVALVLLTPLAVRGFCVALVAAAVTLRAWRSARLTASVRHALGVLGSAYRVTSRKGPTPEREDHVVIGANGVFVILACDDTGRVTASEQRLFVNARLPWRNLVEDCRIEALRVGERVRRRLGRSLPVHPVLCFTRALVAVGQEVRGVRVVQVPRLARLLASVAAVEPLAPSDVEEAFAAVTVAAETGPIRPVASPTPTATRPVFRVTRRPRQAQTATRPLSLVPRSPAPQRL